VNTRTISSFLFTILLSFLVVKGVEGTPPVVDFDYVEDASRGCGYVRFINRSYDPDNSGCKLNCSWSFGFGDFAGLPTGAENPEVVFPDSPHTYNVTLRVTKQGTGESASVTKVVTLYCQGNHTPRLYFGGSRKHNENDDRYFSVEYFDEDGDDPVVHQVWVDGKAHDLVGAWGTPDGPNGKLYRQWLFDFSEGEHKYHFYFVDSGGLEVRLPRTDEWKFETTKPNNRPVASGQGPLDVNENDTSQSNTLTIHLNATDADDDTLTFQLNQSPQHGQLDWTPPDVVYTPAPYYYGPDSFRFEVYDGQDLSDPATITINVINVNWPPAADSQSVTTNKGSSKLITLTGSDPDGDTLTYQVVSSPSHGELGGLNAVTGEITYTPDPGFTGNDEFKFKVNDGNLDSENIATVSVTVEDVPNRCPTAHPQSLQTDQDVDLSLKLGGDDPDGDTLTYSIVSLPSHGTLGALNPNTHEVTYSPNAGYTGSDSFDFQVDDSHGCADQATISITVGGTNHAPEADSQSLNTNEDTQKAITLTGNDPDGDSLAYIRLTDPKYGTLTGTAPNYIYTPFPNYNSGDGRSKDSFTFKVNDGALDSNVATVEIDIVPVNDAPTATAQYLDTDRNTALTLTLQADDPDGDVLTYSIISGPTNGTLGGLNSTTGEVTYTPDTNYRGVDSFTFQVSDGHPGGTAQADVQIDVGGTNPAPIAKFTSSVDSTYVGVPIKFDAADSYDPDGDPLVSYKWDFGDGSTGTGVSLFHQYGDYDDYTVVLTVTEKDGKESSYRRIMRITRAPSSLPPLAAFNYFPQAPRVGQFVEFNASRSFDPEYYSIPSYMWYFSDGTVASGKEIKHAFETPGWQEITLTVTNSQNRQGSVTKRIYVEPPVTPTLVEEPKGPPSPPAEELVAPTNVRATRNADGSVILSWDGKCPWTGWTEVQKATGESNGYETVCKLTRATTYIDRAVDADKAYTYRIVNFRGGASKDSRPSEKVTVKALHDLSHFATVFAGDVRGQLEVYSTLNGKTYYGTWISNVNARASDYLKLRLFSKYGEPIKNADVRVEISLVLSKPVFSTKASDPKRQIRCAENEYYLTPSMNWIVPAGRIVATVTVNHHSLPHPVVQHFVWRAIDSSPVKPRIPVDSHYYPAPAMIRVGHEVFRVYRVSSTYGDTIVCDSTGRIPDWETFEKASLGRNYASLFDSSFLTHLKKLVSIYDSLEASMLIGQGALWTRDIAALSLGGVIGAALTGGSSTGVTLSGAVTSSMDLDKLFLALSSGCLIWANSQLKSLVPELEQLVNEPHIGSKLTDDPSRIFNYDKLQALYEKAKVGLIVAQASASLYCKVGEGHVSIVDQTLDILRNFAGGLIGAGVEGAKEFKDIAALEKLQTLKKIYNLIDKNDMILAARDLVNDIASLDSECKSISGLFGEIDGSEAVARRHRIWEQLRKEEVSPRVVSMESITDLNVSRGEKPGEVVLTWTVPHFAVQGEGSPRIGFVIEWARDTNNLVQDWREGQNNSVVIQPSEHLQEGQPIRVSLTNIPSFAEQYFCVTPFDGEEPLAGKSNIVGCSLVP